MILTSTDSRSVICPYRNPIWLIKHINGHSDEMLTGRNIITYCVTNLPYINNLDINWFRRFCILVIQEFCILVIQENYFLTKIRAWLEYICRNLNSCQTFAAKINEINDNDEVFKHQWRSSQWIKSKHCEWFDDQYLYLADLGFNSIDLLFIVVAFSTVYAKKDLLFRKHVGWNNRNNLCICTHNVTPW